MSRKQKKNSGFLDSKYNRATIIALEVAALITVIVLVCAVFNGDIISPVAQTTKYVLSNQQTTEGSALLDEITTDYQIVTEIVVLDDGSEQIVTETRPAVSVELEDPSGWSYDKILKTATDALNKTRAYNGNLTVKHKESFDAAVTESSGGSVVQSVAELMIGWVVDPVDETLNFTNGRATNSEGESVPILLPIKNNFRLTENGISYATVKRSSTGYIIDIELVRESVGMYEIPEHNAAAVGYLDVANFDLSFLEVDSADITYKGSGITLHINSDGYVTYALYEIPLKIKGSGHKGVISGSITFEGEQTEEWALYY